MSTQGQEPGAMQTLAKRVAKHKRKILNSFCRHAPTGFIYDMERRGKIAGDRVYKARVRELCPGVSDSIINGYVKWMLKEADLPLIDGVDYFPGEGDFVKRDGETFLNAWRGWHSKDGDVTPFLKMTESLFGRGTEESRFILDLVAWHAQNPMRYIPFGVIMTGHSPSADAWLGAIVSAFGENGSYFIPSTVNKYRTWMLRMSVGVCSLGSAGMQMATSRAALTGLVRSTRHHTPNGYATEEVHNRALLFATSTVGMDAMLLEEGVYYPLQANMAEPLELADFRAWYETGGAQIVMHHLLTRDVSDFILPATPPENHYTRVLMVENLQPYGRLAYEMMRSEINVVAQWISDSLEWAEKASLSGLPTEQVIAENILSTFPDMTVRPWYTADEILLMFPNVYREHATNKNNFGNSKRAQNLAGLVSSELRSAGLPILMPADGSPGFRMGGKVDNFFIVAEHDRWNVPISQERFDGEMKSFPTYREYVNQLQESTNGGRKA